MWTVYLAVQIVKALQELYARDPGLVETDLGGNDQYNSGEVRRVIEECLNQVKRT